MDTTRCFVAVPIQPPASNEIVQLHRQLATQLDAVRWVALDTIHIILKFVGDIPNLALPQVCEVVSAVSQNTEAFSVGLGGLGVFPTSKSPRVLWAGVADGTAVLRELKQSLDEPLREFGVPIEHRQFTPHLTLGRLLKGVDVEGLQNLIDRFHGKVVTDFVADRLVLYSSIKHRRGHVYEPIHTVRLS